MSRRAQLALVHDLRLTTCLHFVTKLLRFPEDKHTGRGGLGYLSRNNQVGILLDFFRGTCHIMYSETTGLWFKLARVEQQRPPAEPPAWQACPGSTLTRDTDTRLAFFLCSLVMPFQLSCSPLTGSVWPPFEVACACLKLARLFHSKAGPFHYYLCQGPALSFRKPAQD